MTKKTLLLGCLLIVLQFFPVTSPAFTEAATTDATLLESVTIAPLADGAKISIVANGEVRDYHAFTLDHPARIVFDLRGIESPFRTSQSISSDSRWVKKVRHFGHPDKVRLVIDTHKAYLSAYTAQSVARGLEIRVGSTVSPATPGPEAVGGAPPEVALLQSVAIDKGEESIRISVKTDGKVRDYKSFTLHQPARIVFDLFHLTSPYRKTESLDVDTVWVKRVRHYAHPDKVRLVLDTAEAYLSSYVAEPLPDGLEIVVGEIGPSATLKPRETASREMGIGRGMDRDIPAAKPADPPAIRAAVAGAVVPSPAEPIAVPGMLTLSETIEEAIRANIGLKSSREGTKTALALRNIQRSVFLPTFAARYSFHHNYEEVFAKQNQYALTGTVTQPLFAGFSNTNQYQVARIGVDVARLNEKLLRQTVIFSAKQGYFSLLKAQKLLTVSQLSVQQLEAHKNVANNFYQVGMIPLNDLLKAQVELANAMQVLIVVQNNLDIAKSNLNLILRQDINTPIEIVDVTSYTPFDRGIDYCLQTAEAKRPEVETSDLDVRIREKEIKIARKGYYPSIDLRANYYARGTDWNVNGGPGIGDPNSWDVSAVASWNFWEWGRTAQGVKTRRSSLRQAQLKRDDIFDNIRLEVKQAYLRTREAEKNIITVQKAIEQAKENFRISEERYKEQMVTSTDVLDAQTLLTRTMTNYYNALYDFKISKASLHRAMGQEVLE